MSRFDLLIFDWDGTLLDSIGTIVACTRETLEELGVDSVEDGVIRGAIGLGLRETVERICPGCDDDLFHRVVELYRRLWFGGYGLRPTPFTAALPTLEELAKRGYLMAVATAKSRHGLDREMRATGLGRFFEASRTVSESPAKPDPGMVEEILSETGIDAARALVIGDTTHDLQMASNAGVAAVAVSSGSQRAEELAQAGPRTVLQGVSELPAWLVEGR